MNEILITAHKITVTIYKNSNLMRNRRPYYYAAILQSSRQPYDRHLGCAEKVQPKQYTRALCICIVVYILNMNSIVIYYHIKVTHKNVC